MTHTSAVKSIAEGNERLEFLGDALLSVFVALYLLNNLPSDTDEGTLSRARVEIIRRETLAKAARQLGIGDILLMGQGEQKERRNTHDGPLADAFEAVTAALFLDCGEEAMSMFLRETLREPLDAVVATPPERDPKSRLQELLQSRNEPLPEYRTIVETGAGHQQRFVVEVVSGSGTILGRGEAASKRTAQVEAARAALSHLSP